MKRPILLFVLAFISVGIFSQEEKKDKDSNLDFYGFIRNEFFYDTYKGIDGAHEQFYLFPLYVGQDANGEDINEQPSANLQALATRLGVNITGPELFGAKTSGNIEFDFGGIVASEPTLFRIRKAFAAFNWERSALTVGQTWHPFWSGRIFPTVGGLNTGAPFQPFNRSPQVRYDYSVKGLTLSGAAIYQLQYSSAAINSSHQTTPTQAKRNAVIPEMVANIEYSASPVTIGAGISHNITKPRMTVTDTAGNVYKADELLTSMSYLGYLQLKTDMLKIQAKSVYGQNMKHLLIPSGYAVASYNENTGKETYTNYNTLAAYLNVVYGKKWQVGAFGGYIENLGTTDKPFMEEGEARTYGFLPNIQNMYRASGHLALNVEKFRLVAEYELTSATYGTGGMYANDGLYNNTHQTVNNRIQLMMMYFF